MRDRAWLFGQPGAGIGRGIDQFEFACQIRGLRGLGARRHDHVARQSPWPIGPLAEVEHYAIKATDQLRKFLGASCAGSVGGKRLVRRLMLSAGNGVEGHPDLGQSVFEVIAFSSDAVDIHQAGAGEDRLITDGGENQDIILRAIQQTGDRAPRPLLGVDHRGEFFGGGQ